jgi:hypothetical protein
MENQFSSPQPIPQSAPPQVDQTVNPVVEQPAAPPPQPDASPIVPETKSDVGKIKKILIIFVVLLLLSAAGAGAYFYGLPLLQKQPAVDCQNYAFSVNQTGEVTVTNNSDSASQNQSATVYINDAEETTLEVPIIQPGSSSTLGIISAPDQTFTWKVTGSNFCENSGTVELAEKPQITTMCDVIKAYDENWKLLTSTELANLSTGDKVYFTVVGTTESGEFDKARFTINEEVRDETTNVKPDSDPKEYYDQYTIPEDSPTFVVNAQLHESDSDQWF